MGLMLIDDPENRGDLDALRAAGYEIESDDDFVTAFSTYYGFSPESAAMALAPGPIDDVLVIA
jgi:hypothetical protein